MPAPPHPFAEAAARAVASALGCEPDLFVVGAPPDPQLGDFAVACFAAAKALKQPPAVLAARVAERFCADEFLAAASASGPFVNFRARRPALFSHLFAATLGSQGAALVSTEPGAGKTVCIDYSSPNISKHLAYHHIRSTVIGHALVNLYRAVGYRVVGINHLGDWGTTHGMLLAAFAKWGAPEPLTISTLNDLYVRFRGECQRHPELEQEGRAWFKRLEEGASEAHALWTRFREVSLREFESVYAELGVTFDEVRGESEYLADVDAVLATLAEKNLSQPSQGALVVPLNDVDMPPLLLRKQDGTTLYATRDLAAAIYRWNKYHFSRSLYVVDHGQSLHFRQLFAVLARAGFAWAERCAHISFGLVRIGGKKTATRSGNIVLLREVLGEAQRLSSERVREANPDMAAGDIAETARMVGVGAVVFANLASQRDKDVDFEWDEVLSWEGDAGPYLQYAHARSTQILARAHGIEPSPETNPAPLTHDLEWTLARKLIDFGDVVFRAADSSEPHILSRYLLELCGGFSRWYTAGNQDRSLRVLADDPATARARVALVATTREVLRHGLELLGMQAPARM